MPSKRKQKVTKNSLPPIYTYPQYQYMPATSYYPTNPYPPPVQQGPSYLYYPVDQFGNIVGPPVDRPPVNDQYYPEPYRYWDYHSNAPTRDSYRRSPRMSYENSYFHHSQYHHPSPRRFEHGSSSSIPKHPLIATRIMSSNKDEYQAFNVTDLTEGGSTESSVSSRDTVQQIKYYDKLQKTYH